MIFRDNEFTDNAGWAGGAIHIESPHMKDTATLNRPYVYMVNNKFKRNLTYTAGGAVHIRSTRKK
jgi:hypothetical protein